MLLFEDVPVSYVKSRPLKGGLMKNAKALIVLTALATIALSASAVAADRLVLGEMFTNWA